MEEPLQPNQSQKLNENETIPPYFHPETILTNKSARTSSTYETTETRRLALIFTIIELFLVLPVFITTFYVFNPKLQSLGGPSATFLTSAFAFFGTLLLTIINAPFTFVFSYIIRKRVKHSTSTPDKITLTLRICFTIISSIPAILLTLAFLHIITNN